MPENTPQPAVDAAKEIHKFNTQWLDDRATLNEGTLAAIIARNYAPLVSLREDQMQALGLPDDDHTVIADEIRRIRYEGRAHFHDVTRLTERVKELEEDLADESKWAKSYLERSQKVENDNDGLRAKVAGLTQALTDEREDLRKEYEAKIAALEKDREAQKIRGDCLQREVSLWTKWREEQPWVQEIAGYQKQVTVMHAALHDIRNSAGEQVMVTTSEGHSYCVHTANAALYAARAKEDAT